MIGAILCIVASRKATRGRDREATQEKIFRAVEGLLARRGFLGLGVNAVAREARIDKVLIYRYFGGLPELLEAFAERGDFWRDAEEALGVPPGVTARWTAAEASAAMLKGLLRGLRARPTIQEVLRWELAAPKELAEKLVDVRERRGLEVLQRATRDPAVHGGTDAAIAAVVASGLIYLVLRAKAAPEWLGISLACEDGWARIERAVDTIVRCAIVPRDDGGENA